MRRESKRRLIVSIPTSAYRVLLAQAERDDRAAAQQASYLLRRLLEGDYATETTEREPEPAR